VDWGGDDFLLKLVPLEFKQSMKSMVSLEVLENSFPRVVGKLWISWIVGFSFNFTPSQTLSCVSEVVHFLDSITPNISSKTTFIFLSEVPLILLLLGFV